MLFAGISGSAAADASRPEITFAACGSYLVLPVNFGSWPDTPGGITCDAHSA